MVDLSDALVEAAELLTEADRLYRAAEAHQQACQTHLGNMRELWEVERERVAIKYVPTPNHG